MENFTRENRLQESAIKIRKPFKIDPTLCIYSPQENVDSLSHPKIKSWQKFIQNEKKSGKDIDTILDETDIFDEFEEFLPDNEFPLFVITILNGFKSNEVIDKLLDVFDDCKNRK